jgi:hypothetical protein
MSSRAVFALLRCLRSSYQAAVQFDARPGLKFLVQKVCSSNVAANLYKQSAVAYTLYMHILLEVCIRHDDLSTQNVRRLLGDCDGACCIDDVDVIRDHLQSGKMKESGCKVFTHHMLLCFCVSSCCDSSLLTYHYIGRRYSLVWHQHKSYFSWLTWILWTHSAIGLTVASTEGYDNRDAIRAQP